MLNPTTAERVLRGLPGAGLVVAPLGAGDVEAYGPPQVPHAWSTIKPVIAVAVLRARRGGELEGGAAPTTSEKTLVERAVEDSDNEAAAELFSELGSTARATGALQRVLDDAGSQRTKVNGQATRPEFSTYGQTAWPMTDAARFYRALADGCLMGSADTGLVLAAMARVTPTGGSGWGLPTAGFRELRFKAGWGPEQGSSAYTALQYGIVGTPASGGYVIGIVAETPGDAAGAYGEATTIAKRAARVLPDSAGPGGQAACARLR